MFEPSSAEPLGCFMPASPTVPENSFYHMPTSCA
jgi:hypothetical protein